MKNGLYKIAPIMIGMSLASCTYLRAPPVVEGLLTELTVALGIEEVAPLVHSLHKVKNSTGNLSVYEGIIKLGDELVRAVRGRVRRT